MPEPSVQDCVERTLADAVGRAEPPAEPLVLLEQAGVRFGDVQALRGVSLTLRRGDRLALVGANGIGQDHAAAPAARPGAVRRRRDVVAINGRVPVVAMLFQRPFLLSLSVRWNVLLGLWLHGVPRAQRDQRCRRALQRVGLDGAGRSFGAIAVGRPAATPGAGARLGAGARHAAARRAHGQPGPQRQARGRAADRRARRRRRHGGDQHPQPRPGQAPGHARGVPRGRARCVVELPVDRFFNDVLPSEAALFLKGELPWT